MGSTSAGTLASKRRAIVQAHIEAESESHDVAAALRTFHHPRYEVPALGAVADGPDAVSGLLTVLLSAFPDSSFVRRQSSRPTTQ